VPTLRAALLLLVLTAVAGCGTGGRVSLAGDAHTQTEAQRRAELLLDRVYLAGAVRAPTAKPSRTLDTPQDSVTRARSYTVLGTASSMVATLKRQPPPGLETFTPTSTSGNTAAGSTATFKPVGEGNSSMQAVDVEATDAGDGRVSVQLKAAVGWVRSRTQLETVPADVTDATLGLAYGDDPATGFLLRHVVAPAEMAVLSAALASLSTTSPSEYTLCVDPNVALAQLTTHYGGHEAILDIEVGGCDEVDVEVDGVEQPLLDHDGPVVRAVASILHLTLPSR
jgi:hypothetical protein